MQIHRNVIQNPPRNYLEYCRENWELTLPHILNPLIGMTPQDTIEKVSIYLERLGRALSDEHGDPSISLVTEAAVAALRYEAERVDDAASNEKMHKPRIAGPLSEKAA